MSSPDLSRRVARALYATPNALNPRLLRLVQKSSQEAESFDDLPEKVQKIVTWVEQYIGQPGQSPAKGDEVEDGSAGA